MREKTFAAFVLRATICAACSVAEGFFTSVIRQRPESNFRSLLLIDVARELNVRALLAGVEGVGFNRWGGVEIFEVEATGLKSTRLLFISVTALQLIAILYGIRNGWRGKRLADSRSSLTHVRQLCDKRDTE